MFLSNCKDGCLMYRGGNNHLANIGESDILPLMEVFLDGEDISAATMRPLRPFTHTYTSLTVSRT